MKRGEKNIEKEKIIRRWKGERKIRIRGKIEIRKVEINLEKRI